MYFHDRGRGREIREAQRRLRKKAPLHVAAGEYVSALETLGDAGSIAQAVQFFLHNSIRPEMTRTMLQVAEAQNPAIPNRKLHPHG